MMDILPWLAAAWLTLAALECLGHGVMGMVRAEGPRTHAGSSRATRTARLPGGKGRAT